MATVAAKSEMIGDGLLRVSWLAMDDGDDGDPVMVAQFPDRTVQVVGDATSVSIEGSNDGTNWFALTDPAGEEIGMAGATFDMAMIRENPLYVRPVATGGTDTDVILVGASDR